MGVRSLDGIYMVTNDLLRSRLASCHLPPSSSISVESADAEERERLKGLSRSQQGTKLHPNVLLPSGKTPRGVRRRSFYHHDPVHSDRTVRLTT